MPLKTLEANSIPIPPHLAGLLKQALGRTGTGFDEGAFLQQLHYWTLNPATRGWIVDSVKWIYNSLKSWQEQFPWMTQYALRKAIANLKKLDLIQTAQHWITSYQRVMFYRIDYERLNEFAGNLCDLTAPRRVNSDHLDVRSEHTTYTDTSSNTSLSEQQTVVVSGIHESQANTNPLKPQNCNQASGVAAENPGGDTLSPASSGNNFAIQDKEFPELIEAVAQAIAHPAGSPLPTALRRAIAQFPDRVRGAIAYLKHQQRKRRIENPVGYLYEAIIAGWELTVPHVSVPAGFSEWFKRTREEGLVVAAMVIDGIHHTLHRQGGWIPTIQLMKGSLRLK